MRLDKIIQKGNFIIFFLKKKAQLTVHDVIKGKIAPDGKSTQKGKKIKIKVNVPKTTSFDVVKFASKRRRLIHCEQHA
jgi:hypothetical protein